MELLLPLLVLGWIQLVAITNDVKVGGSAEQIHCHLKYLSYPSLTSATGYDRRRPISCFDRGLMEHPTVSKVYINSYFVIGEMISDSNDMRMPEGHYSRWVDKFRQD